MKVGTYRHSLEVRERLRIASTGRKHSAETRAKISAGRKGMNTGYHGGGRPRGLKHSDESREKMARAFANRSRKYSDTWMEKALALLLDQGGLVYEKQKRFGRCVVDFWLPDEQLVFEADGDFWHQDKEKEARRDEYLTERGALAVVHISTCDLRNLRSIS
jgi:very-short-patch-repair endonuclease